MIYLIIDSIFNTLVNIPLKYYGIFVIEEKYGFNK